MDSSPPTPNAPPVAPVRRHAFRRFGIVFAVVVVLAIVLLLFCLPSVQPQFAWLTPAQAVQANHPGPLTQLKYKLIRLAGPLMRHFPSHRPSIMITAYIFTVPAKLGETVPDAPRVANSEGANAWILSPVELFSYQQRLKANPDVSLLFSPRIMTSSGVQARFSIGQSVPGYASNIGITLDAAATASSGSINLLVNATDTQLAGPVMVSGTTVETNLSTACRARLPDAGGLVITCRKAGTSNGTNYWLIISPMLVDATGKPLKK
jgi:hypothetical protein